MESRRTVLPQNATAAPSTYSRGANRRGHSSGGAVWEEPSGEVEGSASTGGRQRADQPSWNQLCLGWTQEKYLDDHLSLI